MRTLEELGIGRPSTYASILGTILDRGYVFKRGTALVPAFLAFSVVGLLEQHFGRLVDYDFTARMEDDLDRIAAGDEQRVEWLGRFYFGDESGGLAGARLRPRRHRRARDQLARDRRRDRPPRRALRAVPRARRAARQRARGARARRADGRAGRGASRAAQRRPRARHRSRDRADNRRRAPAATARTSARFFPRDSKEKPRTASLFKTMSLDTVTLDEALRLLQLPRVVGVAPDGEEVVARNGRYGPYVQKEKESRSLESEEQLFTISLEEALALLAQPKQRRGQRAGDQAAPRARHRPGRRQGDRPQGRPLRALRHRRRDEREPAQGRRSGDGHPRPRARAARRAPREGTGEAGRPSPQGFLNGSPQTSPTGPRPMLTDRSKRGIHLPRGTFDRTGAAALPTGW